MSHLDSLAALLADLLDLPDTLDLPKLAHVKVELHHDDEQPVIQAQLMALSTGDTWAAIAAWQSATGGTVEVSAPIRDSYGKPYRSVGVLVGFGGRPVRVWGHVDASIEVPERFREITQVAA
jgi:hypothetical protein